MKVRRAVVSTPGVARGRMTRKERIGRRATIDLDRVAESNRHVEGRRMAGFASRLPFPLDQRATV
jgi:hypothetical protein